MVIIEIIDFFVRRVRVETFALRVEWMRQELANCDRQLGRSYVGYVG